MNGRCLACALALLLASAAAQAERCGGQGAGGGGSGGGGGGATRLWLSGEHNATGHWTASLRLERDSAVGRTGRQRVQLLLEPSTWRCGPTRTDALHLTLTMPPPPPGPDYLQWKGSLYRLNPEFVTWERAKAACEADGAHLLVLNSQEEAAFVQDMIHRLLNSSRFFHIGFHDKREEANYVTVFGEPLANAGFNKWCPGEPSGGSPEGLEHCGSITREGCLNDITCNVYESPFFCEQSAY